MSPVIWILNVHELLNFLVKIGKCELECANGQLVHWTGNILCNMESNNCRNAVILKYNSESTLVAGDHILFDMFICVQHNNEYVYGTPNSMKKYNNAYYHEGMKFEGIPFDGIISVDVLWKMNIFAQVLFLYYN